MPVCRHRLWSMTNHCDCLREELFCRIHISFLAQSRIDQIAVVINCPIQVTPLPMDLDVRLIYVPGCPCLTTSFCPQLICTQGRKTCFPVSHGFMDKHKASC